MKSKKLIVSMLIVLLLGMATSAFADLTCAITTTPAPREVLNSHWANTGDLTFTCTAPNATPTTDASITVFYSGLPITNSATLPADHAITVTNTSGTLAAARDTTRPDPGFGGSGVNQSGSAVAIIIPAQAVPAAGTFVLSNVVLSMAGSTTAGQPIAANVNVVSQSGNVTLTGSPIVIISSVLPYLNNSTNPPDLLSGTNPATFTAAGANPPASASCSTLACQNARATFSVVFTEDHIDTWRAPAQYYYNGVGVSGNGTNVLLSFAGMLPGSIISNCVLVGSTGTWSLTGSGIAGTNGQTSLVAEVTGGVIDQTVLDTLQLSCGTSTTNPAYLPGASIGSATTPVTVSASAFPTGSAINFGFGATVLTGGYPRYATGSAVGPVTVINFIGGVSGQTTMLIPWVTASGAAAPPAGTFNTGVTIANTTKDPAAFGTDAQGAAVDTSGNITFYFFPADGSASFTVTPATGFGLQSGVLPAGGTFIGNFSDILKAGNNTGSFSGYVFIVTNFTHAHGSAFVYGGGAADRLTSAQTVLTLGNPSTFSRNQNFGFLPPVEITGF